MTSHASSSPADFKRIRRPGPVAIEPRSDDFRDHLATADKDGKRRWLYPKKVTGKWYRRRTYVSWVLLGLMFIGPFVSINGNPLLMFNIVERKFSILGQMFWPQDAAIFAVAMLLFIMSIIVFTTAFGRLWCGWACPQTVLMEMVFRKIEYLIEGDSVAQRVLAASSWTRAKVTKRAIKHGVFILLSFLIGNWLLSYIIGLEALLDIVTDDPRRHLTGLGFMVGFTALFYLNFARFREQACTFICPYGRLQSAILDENTMVVAYDFKRGEGRSPLHRDQSWPARRAEGLGDCVSCNQCVAVCPTGIDIRNGTQMECVNCTACIDACDTVMKKVGRDPGLIRFASLNSIEKVQPFRVTGRMKAYAVVLVALVGLLGLLLFTRSDAQSALLRAPGALYQELPGERIANLYTIKTLNKSGGTMTAELRLENMPGEIRVMGTGVFAIPPEAMGETSLLISTKRSDLASPKTKIRIGLYSKGKRIETLTTTFVGPRN